MSLILLLVAYFLDKYAAATDWVSRRMDPVILQWQGFLHSSIKQDWFKGWVEALMTIGVPVLLLFWILTEDGGFLVWLGQSLLSLLLLLWCLGRVDQAALLTDYKLAMTRSDHQAAYHHAKESLGLADTTSIEDCNTLGRAVSKELLFLSNRQFFAIVLYFLLLGPLGSLVYYLCWQYQNEGDNRAYRIAYDWLDWLPARVSALIFSLAGDFAGAMGRFTLDNLMAVQDHRKLLEQSGLGAVGVKESDVCEEGLQENEQVLELLERARILTLVLTAIMTLLGWLN